MSDKSPFSPEKISMIEFKFMKGQVDMPEMFEMDKVKGHKLENSLELAFNLEEKLVKADFNIQISTESEEANDEETKGSFHLVFIYDVENLEDLAKPAEDGLIDVHPDLGNALSAISYSTARGILLTRLQGTALQNFVLPVINPNKLLHKK